MCVTKASHSMPLNVIICDCDNAVWFSNRGAGD